MNSKIINNSKKVFCIKISKMVQNKIKVTYEHFIFKESKSVNNINKLNNEINEIRKSSINDFLIRELSFMIELLKSESSLNIIAKKLNRSIKTVKKHFNRMKDYQKYIDKNGKVPICQHCKKKIDSASVLSIEYWVYKTKEIREKPQKIIKETTKNIYKPMFEFFKNYQKIYEKIKKLSPINKAKLPQNKYKFLQKRSVANLINDFKKYAKENNIEIAIPSLQAIYYLINNHKLIDFKILPIKKTFTVSKVKKRMTKRSRITFAKSIEERPEYINNRSEFGHYEIDTVILNKRSKYCYLTLLERKSRKLFIKVIQRNSDSMANGLKTIIKENKLKIKSITMDNGSENVKLNTIDKKIDIYVCHPYCSFEKGSIENCHKFIRQFIPKGINRKYALIDEFVLKMQNEINSLNRNYKDLKIQTFASKMFEDQNI